MRIHCHRGGKDAYLVWLIENDKRPFVALFRCILEIVDVFAHDFTVSDQVALTIHHVRNHHDLVDRLVGEFEGSLGRLNIVRHNDGIGTLDTLLEMME